MRLGSWGRPERRGAGPGNCADVRRQQCRGLRGRGPGFKGFRPGGPHHPSPGPMATRNTGRACAAAAHRIVVLGLAEVRIPARVDSRSCACDADPRRVGWLCSRCRNAREIPDSLCVLGGVAGVQDLCARPTGFRFRREVVLVVARLVTGVRRVGCLEASRRNARGPAVARRWRSRCAHPRGGRRRAWKRARTCRTDAGRGY